MPHRLNRWVEGAGVTGEQLDPDSTRLEGNQASKGRPRIQSSQDTIVSSITKIPVDKEIAMTGEVTVTGQVLPIGGLKEKLLAAHRAGVKKVLIPKDNEKDLVDIPQKVREDIKIIPVETADEVLKISLIKELKPIEWSEVDKISETKKDDKSQASIQ